MLRIYILQLLRASAALVTLITTTSAVFAASFHTAATPAWGRPGSDAAASAALTTYQEWDAMSPAATVPSVDSPLAAPLVFNPNASGPTQPVWYDSSSPSDGAFAAGTDVYSFGGVITPVAVIPGYNLPGHVLNVSVEVQTFGANIDTSGLTASYRDPGGNPHTVSVSSLPSFAYSQVYNDGGSNFGGFGTAYLIDNLWTFTLPQDTASLQLGWSWGVTSSAIQALSVDTQSVAVPEPDGIVLGSLAAIGSIVFVSRRGGQRWLRSKC